LANLAGIPILAPVAYPFVMTAFAERMERLRQAKGVSLRALGAAVLMSHGNLSKILSGKHGATEDPNHRRLRPPTPPLGPELEMWFDALGASEAESRILRMLAAAAHVPHDQTREELERMILKYEQSSEFLAEVEQANRQVYQIGDLSRGRASLNEK
jgi:transcriptional regulator with XRE-family HTH domain